MNSILKAFLKWWQGYSGAVDAGEAERIFRAGFLAGLQFASKVQGQKP